MADLTLSTSRLAGEPHRGDLLVVGPSLGTSVTALWSDCAGTLGDRFEVVGWDLPGHGRSVRATAPFSVADLARSVAAIARGLLGRDPVGRRCWYAGVSLGGAVGLQLSLDDGPFEAVVAIAAAASIGQPSAWHGRAGLVRRAGTPVMVEGSARRWFAPGFVDRNPGAAARLLNSLWDADAESYAKACEALATYDLRRRVGAAQIPVLLLPGAHDEVVTVENATRTAGAVPGAEVHVLNSCGHLGSAEEPAVVAEVLTGFFTHDTDGTPMTTQPPSRRTHESGMAVRREVLGHAHVDAAEARKDDFTEEFQDLITRYAWGEIWTRPGLERRMRSAVTLTALIALGHWDEFEIHVRAALRTGLSQDEVGEVLLQCAIYCGVPAANHAFALAQAVLNEVRDER